MGTFTKLMTGLTMIAALAACGGGDPEADAREQLSEMGFSDKLTDCVLDELKDKAGSIDKFTDLSASEQQSMATDAGAACASEADPDEIGDVVENSGLDLNDEAARKSIIQGMTSTGVPEEMANCIIDAAIDEGLEVNDLMDATKVQSLAADCQ